VDNHLLRAKCHQSKNLLLQHQRNPLLLNSLPPPNLLNRVHLL
jgi:hypothetical protein